jgi:hypothetical protein
MRVVNARIKFHLRLFVRVSAWKNNAKFGNATFIRRTGGAWKGDFPMSNGVVNK